MFAIRGNGYTFESTNPEKYGQEETYNNLHEAELALQQIQVSLSFMKLEIVQVSK